MTPHAEAARQAVEAVYRADSRRVLSTLIRLLGDFDRAEEALHDAFAAALHQWPVEGVPANPRAWLVSTGRFRAIDHLRRRARHDRSLAGLADTLERQAAAAAEAAAMADAPAPDASAVDDDRLRLVFTCCHPALPPEARLALTLREVCGLTTEEVARAFLASPSAIAQRIVRAKAKIRDARIPYQVPSARDLPSRLDGVLQVVYLLFNEGYAATGGPVLTRADLSAEAIRLARLLSALLPDPEVDGLLALLLLHDARRAARTTPDGDLVLLEDQDRTQWDRAAIAEGLALVERAIRSRRFGAYTLQAAIAAVHAEAPTSSGTDWRQIVGLYDVLLRHDPSPVFALNRAVAVAMWRGPAEGLALVEQILAGGDLAQYHLAHAAHADLCRRVGRVDDARSSYQRARELATQVAERRFLDRRLAAIE